jgi:protein TonB
MTQTLLQSTYSNPFLRGGSDTPFKNFWKIVLFVLVAHILVWIVGKYGLPEFKVKKKADITIELSAAPFSTATPTPPQPQKQPTPPKTQEKSPDAVQKAPVEQSQPAAPAQSSSSTDSVQTADADYKAAYLNNPKPPYPSFAFQNRQEGTVILRVHVLPSGEVDDVQLARTSGFDSLDDSALNTVKKWKFVPAKQNGKIVDQWVKVPIRFGLKNT